MHHTEINRQQRKPNTKWCSAHDYAQRGASTSESNPPMTTHSVEPQPIIETTNNSDDLTNAAQLAVSMWP